MFYILTSFCLLGLSEGGMLKSSTITVVLPVSSCNLDYYIHIFFFEDLFLGAWEVQGQGHQK